MKTLILIIIAIFTATATVEAETWNGQMQLVVAGRGCPTLHYSSGEYPLVMSDSVEEFAWSAKFDSVFLKNEAKGLAMNGNRNAAGNLAGGWSVNVFPDSNGVRLIARLETVNTCSVWAQGILRRGNPNINLAGFWGMSRNLKSGEEAFNIMITQEKPGVWRGVPTYYMQGVTSEFSKTWLKGTFASGLFDGFGWKVVVMWLDETTKQIKISLERPGYKDYMLLKYMGEGQI